MEVTNNNLLDNIIYRANIFNYDSKFFNEFRERKLKLNLNLFCQSKKFFILVRKSQSDAVPIAISFLNQKSHEQYEQIINLILQNEDQGPQQQQLDEEDLVETNQKRLNKLNISYKSKEARTTLLVLLDVLAFSLSQLTANESKKLNEMHDMGVDQLRSMNDSRETFLNNILYCLLYLDGLMMFNIDIIRKLDEFSPLLGLSLPDLLFDLISSTHTEDQIKEVSSHLLSAHLVFVNPEGFPVNKWKDLMHWNFDYYLKTKRENSLTSNFSLILSYDPCVEYFCTSFEAEKHCLTELFGLMFKENNYNTIYEALFCVWNISNYKSTLHLFENKSNKFLEKIVQVIKTNKIDKIARIGLVTIKNLLVSNTCLEILLDIKFMRTIDILLTNKWNDAVIRDLLNDIYDYLERNYKIMNSFEKYKKELETGDLKWGSLHESSFWEDNYKEFEFNSFEYIKMLVKILQSPNLLTDRDIEMKCIACSDLGEFARLYPAGASLLEHFGAKDALLFLINKSSLDLKNRALVCLQKIMMRSLKK